jgi:hypothetical protein
MYHIKLLQDLIPLRVRYMLRIGGWIVQKTLVILEAQRFSMMSGSQNLISLVENLIRRIYVNSYWKTMLSPW